MRELSAGWATDVCVLARSGSVIHDHGDHLEVRTPGNPDFHWGNCLLVTDPRCVDQPHRWVARFHDRFPAAGWVAIGLPRMPTKASAWVERGLHLELADVLTAGSQPASTPLPVGYSVRQLAGHDWEQWVARWVRENARTGEYEPVAHQRHLRARVAALRDMTDHTVAAFFGAFTDEHLVAELGIVACGTTARYQAVGTDEDHRRRGPASHLLGVAAQWSAHQGCDQWVIVTEASNPAGRVYRAVGFAPDSHNVTAYRPPQR